ncbi:MAG: hypothetical protein RLZZ04_1631 [Cyanobacteriota bacterium]|jgi:hypothetical protein
MGVVPLCPIAENRRRANLIRDAPNSYLETSTVPGETVGIRQSWQVFGQSN